MNSVDTRGLLRLRLNCVPRVTLRFIYHNIYTLLSDFFFQYLDLLTEIQERACDNSRKRAVRGDAPTSRIKYTPEHNETQCVPRFY